MFMARLVRVVQFLTVMKAQMTIWSRVERRFSSLVLATILCTIVRAERVYNLPSHASGRDSEVVVE